MRKPDTYYMRWAYQQALRSPDLSTQNGAVVVNTDGLVIGAGSNDIPFRVRSTPERLKRPAKYHFTEHAERAALFNAAGLVQDVGGSTMYCLWAACSDCARAIISLGVRELVTHSFYTSAEHGAWSATIADAFEMLKEAGVEVRFVNDRIIPVNSSPLRFNGKEVRF